MVDEKIPHLKMNFDSNILALPINQNIQQQFQFEYQEIVDPDFLFYSANVIYDFGIVSTIVYHYPTVNFRIWDFFEGFTKS